MLRYSVSYDNKRVRHISVLLKKSVQCKNGSVI